MPANPHTAMNLHLPRNQILQDPGAIQFWVTQLGDLYEHYSGARG
jgi:hypothetical protein